MKSQQQYQPDWQSEETICKWLGVTANTLYKWRSSKGLAWTTMGGGKTILYDRKQITEMLNQNSTYAIIGDKQLTA